MEACPAGTAVCCGTCDARTMIRLIYTEFSPVWAMPALTFKIMVPTRRWQWQHIAVTGAKTKEVQQQPCSHIKKSPQFIIIVFFPLCDHVVIPLTLQTIAMGYQLLFVVLDKRWGGDLVITRSWIPILATLWLCGDRLANMSDDRGLLIQHDDNSPIRRAQRGQWLSMKMMLITCSGFRSPQGTYSQSYSTEILRHFFEFQRFLRISP